MSCTQPSQYSNYTPTTHSYRSTGPHPHTYSPATNHVYQFQSHVHRPPTLASSTPYFMTSATADCGFTVHVAVSDKQPGFCREGDGWVVCSSPEQFGGAYPEPSFLKNSPPPQKTNNKQKSDDLKRKTSYRTTSLQRTKGLVIAVQTPQLNFPINQKMGCSNRQSSNALHVVCGRVRDQVGGN